jgi:hypothetical protein
MGTPLLVEQRAAASLSVYTAWVPSIQYIHHGNHEIFLTKSPTKEINALWKKENGDSSK